jgi:hypothetical protein
MSKMLALTRLAATALGDVGRDPAHLLVSRVAFLVFVGNYLGWSRPWVQIAKATITGDAPPIANQGGPRSGEPSVVQQQLHDQNDHDDNPDVIERSHGSTSRCQGSVTVAT